MPRRLRFPGITSYNLVQLRSQIEEAGTILNAGDDLLQKGLEYHNHAGMMAELAWEQLAERDRESQHLISAAFLNAWKAITVILGEPKIQPAFQKRCELLAIDAPLLASIDEARRLRNDFDVAHAHASQSRGAPVEEAFGRASATASEVLKRYASHLQAKSKQE